MDQLVALKELGPEELNRRSTSDSWSVLECIEHLKRYSDFYNPEIAKRIQESRHPAQEVFRSGLLGEYFAKTMLPKEKGSKMKTFKVMDPIHSNVPRSVLDTFIEQQKVLLGLLDQARKVSLNKTKTSISISKLIKLKLGDTMRVVVYHEQRHMKQIERVLARPIVAQ